MKNKKVLLIFALFFTNLYAFCDCSFNVAYNYAIANKTIIKAYQPMFKEIDLLNKNLKKTISLEKKENIILRNNLKIEIENYLFLRNIVYQLNKQNNLIFLQIKNF